MSATTGVIEIAIDSDLPPSSYDGSHLPWKSYRHHVLGPHRIRIVETAPKEKLPTNLLAMIEADMPNAARFDDLKQSFREQVVMGRGFGPSPLFPPNLLPPIDNEPRLARCMIPYFSREALPERAINQMGPLYELNIPRSGLGCGFSSSALNTEELNVLPSWLVTTGTIVHFDTGYISPGAAVYCPFLVFERAHAGDREQRLEVANNQCATGGACCVRALQMLYAQAWKGQMMPELPISFSCVIENSFAVMNLHWIDHGQAYCMAPLCKFDLTKDEHFNQFLVWVDSIGKWALRHLLPLVQRALELLRAKEDTPPPTPRATRLTLDTTDCPNDALIKSLKTTFENIPWRFEDDEFTPVSSSTASWGSPMVNDTSFTYYPAVPRQAGRTPTSAVQRKQYLAQVGQHPTPPPAYAHNPELVWQRRFAHAMDEIRDLQRQIQTLRTDVNGSNLSMQNELSGIKNTVHSVLRKETLTLRNRSISLGVQEMWSSQNVPRSPLVNEVRPSISPEKASFYEKRRNNSVPLSPKVFFSGLPSPGLPSPGMPSPGMQSPGMPSPTFSMYSENNMVVIPPAPPKSASFLKFVTAMITGHMIGVFIPNTLLRIFVLGCVTDVCMLAFASPHLPSSAEYLLSLWRTSR
ncbi:hypothetical protein LTR99_004471 [Exophiala xenobiotica]|uniref:DUF7924 domain-containing protein n=1 Tax=Vermiconidia calcicola TaxID=1690605 RepID=A0AAV9QC32_9PEZI|nr:hypothetical protein H2202_003275 [Exophiala xenobiotica]KAK5539751.1 hypothetical protein LTR25_003456 [Vermiconidia calcicola]KAK5541737.1 hypothetical protein LTR23_005588 [Chaetothyriales sp. CCFEE 6169]KAK5237300.1 hypothetical protein LTR47_001566 [Exophiala xenobiotica]KAK5242309.1 hypothetical protein LTS06_011604 [Exophiala xenobiotica]